MRQRTSRSVVLVAIAGCAGLAVVAGGCGYALAGRGNSLPANVRVIGVPQFGNRSTTPGVEREITDAVQAEFAGRGGLRALPTEDGADAIVRGIVTGLYFNVAAANTSGQATRYEIVVTASVEFVNTLDNDTVLWSNRALNFREEYDVPAGTTTEDPAAFFRQDVNALQRLSRNFARSVVTSILEAF
jgi:hypothetical protein